MGIFDDIRRTFGIGVQKVQQVGQEIKKKVNIAKNIVGGVQSATTLAKDNLVQKTGDIVKDAIRPTQKYPTKGMIFDVSPEGKKVIDRRVQIAQEEKNNPIKGDFVSSLPNYYKLREETQQLNDDRRLKNTIIDSIFEKAGISKKDKVKSTPFSIPNKSIIEKAKKNGFNIDEDTINFLTDTSKKEEERFMNTASALSGEPLKEVGNKIIPKTGIKSNPILSKFIPKTIKVKSNLPKIIDNTLPFENIPRLKKEIPLLSDINSKISSESISKEIPPINLPEKNTPLTNKIIQKETSLPLNIVEPQMTKKTDLLPSKTQSSPIINEKEFNPEKYVKELTDKQKKAEAGPIQNFGQKVQNFYKDVKRKLVDSNAPIEDAIRKAQKDNKYETLPKYDISNKIDRVYRAPTLAGQFAKDNGLVDVVKGVDSLENLDQYLIAKHAQELEAKGVKTGRNLANDRELIKSFAPQYEEYAQKVNGYSQKLLDNAVENGLISKELSIKLKQEYPNYVPFNRIFDELEKVETKGVGGGPTSLSAQTIVQKIDDSIREIDSPVASLMAKTNDAFVQGERNNAARTLAMHAKSPGMEHLIRELSEGESAAHTFSYLENGVKKTFATTPEIAAAAKALNVQQLNILGKILAFPTRIARIGITGLNIPFTLTNLAKDQMFATITSNKAFKTSFINVPNFIKSLFSAIGHGKLYEEVIRSGAGGTSFDLSRGVVKQTVERIRSNKNVISKIKYVARHPSELLRAVENVIGRSEELTRIQQYRGTKEALIKEGRTIEDAKILAAKAARENTANFARKGEWGSVLNNAFLYLNANIQGGRSFVRAFQKNPVGTGTKIATTLLLPMAYITTYNLKDPNRKMAYDSIPEYEKENNFIIIPPSPERDKNGKWNIIKIPIPPGVSKLTVPVRRVMEQVGGGDQVKFAEVANSIFSSPLPFDITKVENGKIKVDTNSILSTFTPQIIKPAIEAQFNKSFFTGNSIVSPSLEKLSPELQVKDNTSGVARFIGKVSNTSPIKVENFVKGTTGGFGMQMLNLTDRALAGLDIIPKEQVGGEDVWKALLGRFTKASGGEIERKQVEELKEIIQKQDDDRFRLKQEAELIYEELKKLPKEEANLKAKELKDKNSELFEKVKDVSQDAKLGLTYNDRLIKNLGVENQERAKFILSKTEQLKTSEEKNAYIKELKEKKIITKQVMGQLKKLLNKDV